MPEEGGLVNVKVVAPDKTKEKLLPFSQSTAGVVPESATYVSL